jgi:hypothetical protein
MASLDGQLPPHLDITIMHLGRGGVKEDGALDAYNKGRVEWTLDIARAIANLRPHAEIKILWTGGCNRKQDRAGAERPASEGGAALQYANTLIKADDRFVMLAEQISTSTVENATASAGAGLVPDDSAIVVVTDPLHYMARKIQFIMRLVFPRHKLTYVELPSSPPDTTWKSVAKHLVSTFITTAGMIGVTRGDAPGIQRRQVWLQDHTGH